MVTNEGRTSFSFSAIDKDGNPVTDASRLDVQFLDGSDYFVFSGFDAAGNIIVELTQAGIDALRAGTLVDDMLTIEVDGEAYKMPLVINSGQNYNAADEEARANLGTDLKAEWYSTESSLENKSVILGGSDYNQVDVDGSLQSASGESTTINTAAGDASVINIKDGVVAYDLGINTITGGAGDDSFTSGSYFNAVAGGTNTLNLGDGTNTINIKDGVVAYNLGINTIIGGSGDDSVTIGRIAVDDGTNTLALGGGTNTINIKGEVEAMGEGINTIMGGSGNDSVTIDKVIATNDGKNTFDLSGGTNTINIKGEVATSSSGLNTIRGGSGNDSVTIDSSVTASGGTNTLDLGDGTNTINIKGEVKVSGTGINTIIGGSDNDSVTIDSSVTASGGTNTLDLGDGTNTINIKGEVKVSGTGINTITGGSDNDSVTIDSSVTAIMGKNTFDLGAGTNTINIKGGVKATDGINTITGGSGDDSVTVTSGVFAHGGTNTLGLGGGTNTINIQGKDGLNAQNAGANTVLSGSGADKFTTTGRIYAVDGSKNLVDLGTGADSIEVGYLHAQDKNSSNTLKSGGDVLVDTDEEALTAIDAGSNTIVAGGDVLVGTDASRVFMGIRSDGAGSNTISAGGDVTINATNSALYANGAWGNTPSEREALRSHINISADNDINLSAKNSGEAKGIYTLTNVGVKLEAGRDITVEVEGQGAMAFIGSSATDITAGRNISFSAKATGKGCGLYASGTFDAGNKITVNVDAKNNAYGADVQSESSILNVSAKEFEMIANSTAGDAMGIYTGSYGHATVKADTINIKAVADGTGSAYGLHEEVVSKIAAEENPNAETFALLQGNDITLVAEAKDTGNAYGMYIQGPTNGTAIGANNIAALHDDHSLTVTIIAKSGTAGNAYAMWAEYDNATNTITGSDKADSITLVGDLHAAHTGENVINTGGGDDSISLHGKVDSIGSLHLNAGEGYDILTLVADDFAQFEEYYGTWLKATFGTMDVEAIHINIAGLTEADQNALDTFFSDPMFEHTDFTYLASSDSQANGYSDVASFSALSLGDLISTGEDENVLNMAGNSINSLVINENSLETLLASNGLSRIMGDSADTISFETVGWENSGANTVVDGVMYDTYINNDATILIQQEIIVNIVG